MIALVRVCVCVIYAITPTVSDVYLYFIRGFLFYFFFFLSQNIMFDYNNNMIRESGSARIYRTADAVIYRAQGGRQ